MVIFNNEISKSYDEWYQTPLGNLVDEVEKDLIWIWHHFPNHLNQEKKTNLWISAAALEITVFF